MITLILTATISAAALALAAAAGIAAAARKVFQPQRIPVHSRPKNKRR